MKVLVTPFSLTGNTTQIARAIYQEVLSRGHEVELKALNKVSAASLNDYDLVFLGAACHDSDLAQPAKLLLAEIGDAPAFKLAGFVTHATKMPDEGERCQALYKQWAGGLHSHLYPVERGKADPLSGLLPLPGRALGPDRGVHSRHDHHGRARLARVRRRCAHASQSRRSGGCAGLCVPVVDARQSGAWATRPTRV